MKHIPSDKYRGMPYSYVATGCAYENVKGELFLEPLPEGLKNSGYLSLDSENRYLRSLLPVKKKVYYKRAERVSLKDFLDGNDEKCVVCVYGHLVYVSGKDYWSYFQNEDDPVVCVWYIKEEA